MQYNFIRTTDVDTKNALIKQGFKLLSQDGGVYTFLNDSTLTFEYTNKDKIQYTNILAI